MHLEGQANAISDTNCPPIINAGSPPPELYTPGKTNSSFTWWGLPIAPTAVDNVSRTIPIQSRTPTVSLVSVVTRCRSLLTLLSFKNLHRSHKVKLAGLILASVTVLCAVAMVVLPKRQNSSVKAAKTDIKEVFDKSQVAGLEAPAPRGADDIDQTVAKLASTPDLHPLCAFLFQLNRKNWKAASAIAFSDNTVASKRLRILTFDFGLTRWPDSVFAMLIATEASQGDPKLAMQDCARITDKCAQAAGYEILGEASLANDDLLTVSRMEGSLLRLTGGGRPSVNPEVSSIYETCWAPIDRYHHLRCALCKHLAEQGDFDRAWNETTELSLDPDAMARALRSLLETAAARGNVNTDEWCRRANKMIFTNRGIPGLPIYYVDVTLGAAKGYARHHDKDQALDCVRRAREALGQMSSGPSAHTASQSLLLGETEILYVFDKTAGRANLAEFESSLDSETRSAFETRIEEVAKIDAAFAKQSLQKRSNTNGIDPVTIAKSMLKIGDKDGAKDLLRRASSHAKEAWELSRIVLVQLKGGDIPGAEQTRERLQKMGGKRHAEWRLVADA